MHKRLKKKKNRREFRCNQEPHAGAEKSRPEEGSDEAEAAVQEAAERAAPVPAPGAAGGVLPRGRRHLQVRVRGVLHQRVAYHVYVPAAGAAADAARRRGGAPPARRRQDVPEAGVAVPDVAVVAKDRDFDPRRRA